MNASVNLLLVFTLVLLSTVIQDHQTAALTKRVPEHKTTLALPGQKREAALVSGKRRGSIGSIRAVVRQPSRLPNKPDEEEGTDGDVAPIDPDNSGKEGAAAPGGTDAGVGNPEDSADAGAPGKDAAASKSGSDPAPLDKDGKDEVSNAAWDEETQTCCMYDRIPKKRLTGSNVVRPRDTLEDAQEVCDAIERCRGVVQLGNHTGIAEEHRQKFALKEGDGETVDADQEVLYSKGLCTEQVGPCDRNTNTTNATNATNATNVTTNSSCVTHADPRVGDGWLADLAPLGTPCLFGVDPRDEGEHCVHDTENFGSFGWCYTEKDKSKWGSCSEACPLIGHYQVLGEKLDKLTEMVKELVKKTVDEEENTTATAITAAAEAGLAELKAELRDKKSATANEKPYPRA